MRQCSLCGHVLDEQSRFARVKTRGQWVAHESCLAPLPDGGRSIRAAAPPTASAPERAAAFDGQTPNETAAQNQKEPR